MNVSSYESAQGAVDEIVREFDGRLDVFVANSGIAWEEGEFVNGSLDTMSKVLKVNIEGTFNCAKAAALHWRRQRQERTTVDGRPLENYLTGSFICTASMSGSVVNIPQSQAVYNASKAAVIHACKSSRVESSHPFAPNTHASVDGLHLPACLLTFLCYIIGKSFAVEWTGFARANSVSPGYMKTELTGFNSDETKNIWKDKIPMG